MPGMPVQRYSQSSWREKPWRCDRNSGLVAQKKKNALLQAMYQRLFEWVVDKINGIMEPRDRDPRRDGKDTVIGVLDIYGFEVFPVNR